MSTLRTRSRAAAIFATAALAATLTACSTGGDNVTAPSSSNGSNPLKVTFVNPLPQQEQWRKIGDCMKEEATARGVTLTETGPTGQAVDLNLMTQQIQQATANGADAIITNPVSETLGKLLGQAQKKGIVTATMYGSTDPKSGADINISVDWTTLGKMFVDSIATLPGEQRVGLIASGPTGPGGEFIKGVKDAAAATSNVTVIAEVYNGEDSGKALAQANALITAHPDMTVIATHTAVVTKAVDAAIKAHNLLGKLHLVGNGPVSGGIEALQDGTAYSMLVQDLCGEGKKVLDAVVDRIDSKITTPAEKVESLVVATKMASKDEIVGLVKQGWM